MAVETALVDLLAADGTVSGLVGTRLRHEWLDQNATYPAIIVTRISGGRESGLSASTDYWERARIQVDCFGNTYTETKSLGDAVKDVLHGFKGAAGSYQVGSCALDNEVDLGELDGDRGERRVSLDFSVLYL